MRTVTRWVVGIFGVALAVFVIAGLMTLHADMPNVMYDSGTEEVVGCSTAETSWIEVPALDPRCEEAIAGNHNAVWVAPAYIRDNPDWHPTLSNAYPEDNPALAPWLDSKTARGYHFR